MNGEVLCQSASDTAISRFCYQYSAFPSTRPTAWNLGYLIAVYIGSVSAILAAVHYDSANALATLWKSCIAFVIFYVINALTSVEEESLLIIARLGVQTITFYGAGRTSSHFIPWCSIHDIVINEAISGARVVRYLAVIVKDKDGKKSLHPLFMKSRPRLSELKKVYIDVQRILER